MTAQGPQFLALSGDLDCVPTSKSKRTRKASIYSCYLAKTLQGIPEALMLSFVIFYCFPYLSFKSLSRTYEWAQVSKGQDKQ